MMRFKHLRKLSFSISLILLFGISINVFADTAQKGSVTVTMRYEGKSVSGGTLTMYRVGDCVQSNGTYNFTITSEFSPSGENLSDIQSADVASRLASFATSRRLVGETKTVDKYGQVSFDDLDLGAYLFVQTQAPSGYKQISPFFVGIPLVINESGVLDVSASPKIELQKKSGSGGGGGSVKTTAPTSSPSPSSSPSETPTPGGSGTTTVPTATPSPSSDPDDSKPPSGPHTSVDVDDPLSPSELFGPSDPTAAPIEQDDPAEPSDPSVVITPSDPTSSAPDVPSEISASPVPAATPKPKLPQTGQQNWPVPVLAVSGLLCLTVGLLFCDEKKDKDKKETRPRKR